MENILALQFESNLTNLGDSRLLPDRYGVLVIIVRVHDHTRGLSRPSRVDVRECVLLGVCKAVVLLGSGEGVTIIAEFALVSPGSNNPFSILSVHHRVLESQRGLAGLFL